KQCHSLSLKYKKHFPTRKISALCSVQSKEAKSAEELNKINSRHLYVILAELFYSKENYERRSALTLLFSYECENAKICSEYMQVLAREIKKDFLFLHKKDPYFFKNILELKTKVQGRVKIFK
ncbi:MAG: hypothetical protein HY072_00230, partial [Deltaproteobacteria bacterium]|nr:hypothetical protein [Deltaproteobacteria bacterium]